MSLTATVLHNRSLSYMCQKCWRNCIQSAVEGSPVAGASGRLVGMNVRCVRRSKSWAATGGRRLNRSNPRYVTNGSARRSSGGISVGQVVGRIVAVFPPSSVGADFATRPGIITTAEKPWYSNTAQLQLPQANSPNLMAASWALPPTSAIGRHYLNRLEKYSVHVYTSVHFLTTNATLLRSNFSIVLLI